MDILYFLIPLALILVALLVAAFWWAIRSGQFDDLEGPAYSILMDDDEPARKSTDDDTQAAAGAEPPKDQPR